jgi:lysine-N-methylase
MEKGTLSTEEFIWLAHMYSREIEHSDENMDRIEELSGSDMTFHMEALTASMNLEGNLW